MTSESRRSEPWALEEAWGGGAAVGMMRTLLYLACLLEHTIIGQEENIRMDSEPHKGWKLRNDQVVALPLAAWIVQEADASHTRYQGSKPEHRQTDV